MAEAEVLSGDHSNGGQEAELVEKLSGWLSLRLPNRPKVTISDVKEPAQGFSSRTILFTASWHEGAEHIKRPLVARLQRDVAVPMLSDVFHQYRVMRSVAGASDARVPRIDFAETDPSVLGAPFFLMDRIDGRVPSDFPSYHAEGWFAELTDAEREKCWWNGIVEMEKMHRIDWTQFPFLSGALDGAPTAGTYLESFVGHWFEWAAQNQSYPFVEESLRFLMENQPPVHQVGLVWNDARLGNTMFRDDHEVASLLDFEVASLGPPEIDLAHWMYLDDIFSLSFGIPRIGGIPDEAEAIAGFERVYGWKMPYFSYYQAVAALKILILSIRNYGNDKKMDGPVTLPDFLVERVKLYIERYALII